MSTQGRTSDQPEQTPHTEPASATPATNEGTNLLHRWVRLVQQSSLWGNDAGQVRLDELAQGPTTPRIQTLEEIRAARAAAVAQEEEAEGAGATSWWDDAICADDGAEAQPAEEVCETEPLAEVEEDQVCDVDALSNGASSEDRSGLEPQLGEMPPVFTLPPLVTPPTTVSPVPPALPAAAGEGLLSRILAFGARWLGPVVVGMWPKDTAPPELDQQPYTGPEGGLEPVTDKVPNDDNRCRGEKVDHRGGDAVHNECADGIPGNEASGGDWLVTTPEGEKKNFDAWTPVDNTVWEVKTDQFDTSSGWLREKRIRDQILEFGKEQEIANRCGYNFKVAVRDAEQYEMLKERLSGLIEVVRRWECL